MFKCQLCQFFFFFSYILMINFVWLSHSTVNVVVISLELKERNLDWTEEEDRRRQDCKTKDHTDLTGTKVIRLHCNIVHSHFDALHAKYM